MTRVVLSVLAGTVLGVAVEQAPVPPGWQRVTVCDARFVIPADLKQQRVRGIDSCVAEFRSATMRLTVDSGLYGSVVPKPETTLDFREAQVDVDGRKARLITYKDVRDTSSFRFIAELHVVLFEAKDSQTGSQYFTMVVSGKSEKDIDAAKQIFGTIHFN